MGILVNVFRGGCLKEGCQVAKLHETYVRIRVVDLCEQPRNALLSRTPVSRHVDDVVADTLSSREEWEWEALFQRIQVPKRGVVGARRLNQVMTLSNLRRKMHAETLEELEMNEKPRVDPHMPRHRKMVEGTGRGQYCVHRTTWSIHDSVILAGHDQILRE